MLDPNFTITTEEETRDFSKFIIEPLIKGYGHTLGNSLRRVLLTSIKGAAITSVKIEGVSHQFSTVEGLKEDVVELLLNLKNVKFQMAGEEPVTLTLSKKGEGPIVAGDIEPVSGVTVVNPDHYLGEISGKKNLFEMQMTVEVGYGYESADQKKSDQIGVLPVDAVFSPVKRVNYKVESTRVGRMTNLDKLILELWTDGTVNAKDILDQAAKTLVSYFTQVYSPKEEVVEEEVESSGVSEEVLNMKIEELEIPTRIVNALANGGLDTVGDLINAPRADLMKLKNLGGKSLGIIEEKLAEKDVSLSQ